MRNLFGSVDYRRDKARLFWLRQRLFWVPYERYEYTRLSSIRQEMDLHRTYKKENVIDQDDEDDDEIIGSSD